MKDSRGTLRLDLSEGQRISQGAESPVCRGWLGSCPQRGIPVIAQAAPGSTPTALQTGSCRPEGRQREEHWGGAVGCLLPMEGTALHFPRFLPETFLSDNRLDGTEN